jgi:adenylate kinase family enzyme
MRGHPRVPHQPEPMAGSTTQIDAVVVCGVCGSGKTTIAQALSKHLGWIYRDGDEFHSKENIEKMRYVSLECKSLWYDPHNFMPSLCCIYVTKRTLTTHAAGANP